MMISHSDHRIGYSCIVLVSVFLKARLAPQCLVFFFLMRRRPPRSTLFPYTPLFRSIWRSRSPRASSGRAWPAVSWPARSSSRISCGSFSRRRELVIVVRPLPTRTAITNSLRLLKRSEDHTSELHSPHHPLCPLLLVT